MSEKSEGFQEKLIAVGTALNNNRYLGSVKDAFIEFMPFTIAGALALLWPNVICNETTGLGAIWKPIMALSFLNPLFNAINFATLGCIAILIAFFVGAKMAAHSNLNEVFGGTLGVAAFIVTLGTSQTIGDTTVSGLFSSNIGSNGLFTGMLVSIVAVELFNALYKIDALKIKMPDAVPPQIANSFAVMIPAFLDLMIVALFCLILKMTTGLYLNDVILNLIQIPLMKVGGSLAGMIIFQLVILLLWSVGLHGDNIVAGILNPIVTAMTVENMNNIAAGQAATNIFTTGFNRAFFATGGTGFVLGLTIAMFIRARREENRAVAKLAIIPNLFNIGEVNMFGIPVVLSPALIIPFVLCPIVCGTFGYIMTRIGFCPIFAYDVPWTMPPLLIAFVSTGGSWQAVVTQIIAIALSVIIYLPFIGAFEKSQAKTQEEAEAVSEQSAA
jgi:PTS system cellobiose-specific IIC component